MDAKNRRPGPTALDDSRRRGADGPDHRFSGNLAADRALLLIERLLLGGRDVAAVLVGIEALFLADELVLVVQRVRPADADLALLERLVDPPVLHLEAVIHLVARGW